MYTKWLVASFFTASWNVLAFPSTTVSQDHYEVLRMRASTILNPRAAVDIQCLDPSVYVVSHDQNVAELAICNGIAGARQRCEGQHYSTTGSSGTAMFILNPTTPGAIINISKGRWDACIRTAEEKCATGTFSAVCLGGATTGDVAFSLEAQ